MQTQTSGKFPAAGGDDPVIPRKEPDRRQGAPADGVTADNPAHPKPGERPPASRVKDRP